MCWRWIALKPPKGALSAKAGGSFVDFTTPASARLAKREGSLQVVGHHPAARPKLIPLDFSIASSQVAARNTLITGPKISSWAMRMVGST